MPAFDSLKAGMDAAGIAADLQARLLALAEELDSLESCLVAFSGGTDSAFLAYIASQLPDLCMAAVTADSPLAAPGEMEAAAAFAARHGIPHQVITIDPLADNQVRANPFDRCYHCKKLILSKIWEYAAAQGFRAVLDGENADDLKERRPGRRAVEESETLSPLAWFGFKKDEIRSLSRAFGLSTWDKPSSPCLATRIPYGTAITKEALRMVAQAEDHLHRKGFAVARVRVHKELASVEVEPQRIPELLVLQKEMTAAFEKIGFHKVSIDRKGYRSGSLDEGKHL